MIVDDSARAHFPPIINYHELYHARGQTGKTIINYHDNFEHVQSG